MSRADLADAQVIRDFRLKLAAFVKATGASLGGGDADLHQGAGGDRDDGIELGRVGGRQGHGLAHALRRRRLNR